MTTVNIHEAKAHLSALIARVEDHQEHIVICRYGRAVAELGPCRKKKRSSLHRALREVKVKGDLTKPTQEEWERA
ncbi:MAG: type II toxin-antitoxin system Phd/YefM family antitoxin [Kiritimatiellae bacterium]|nr:type II toxin-antitoxin system Phd/YefM family antitoxin [Kiritimatiellia bacterium]